MRGGVEAYARQPSLRGNTLVFSSEAQLWVTELRDDGSPPPLAARLTSSVGRASQRRRRQPFCH